MRVLHGFEGWPRGTLHLAIGAFDGVHLGHQHLVARTRAGAHATDARALAATFDPLPIDVLAPHAPPSALSDADERAERLAAAGADDVVVFTCDAAFLALSAREFADRLAAAGELRRIVVGPDFRFGHDREGNVRVLADLGRERGWEVDVVDRVERDGVVVSSTRIRNLVIAGDVRGAAALLGRPYAVRGHVERGDRRGRALGYPTINIATPPERLLPRDGIYATWANVAGGRHPAATSLGVRPTFGGGERLLESYLLDVEADLYDQAVEIEFVERFRDELRFETAAELVEQIARDVEATRRALGYTGRRERQDNGKKKGTTGAAPTQE